MITAILLLAMMQPQDAGLAPTPASETTTAPVRTEKLTRPSEPVVRFSMFTGTRGWAASLARAWDAACALLPTNP